MARIRTIKPEFWTDEKVVGLSPIARLLFIGMWNFVDDEGRAPFSPARLKMQILPADNADISEIIGEIRRDGLIIVYEVEGKEYFQVCGFARHQKIDKRLNSKHPAPPTHADIPHLSPTEGIKEGKGREEDAAPNGAHRSDLEKELFTRGKQVLGKGSGGMIANLLKAKEGKPELARSVIEMAATKQNPREYVARVITGPPGQTAEGGWRSGIPGVL